MIFENKRKGDKKFNKRKYIDSFIYVFLIIFVILCFCFNLNFLSTSLLAIAFVVVISIFYILEYRINKNLLLNSTYSEKIDNLTKEELKEIIKKYYISLNYKVIENEKYLLIEKNNKKYKVLFLLGQININDLKNVEQNEDISGIVVINNSSISELERKFIKENNFYSITKIGLIDILRNLEDEKSNGGLNYE